MTPIEKPALPEPYAGMYREMTPVLHEAWADQMHTYADTCMAPLLARIEELEKDRARLTPPADVLRWAQSMQKQGYSGPLMWASAIIDWVAALSATKEPS